MSQKFWVFNSLATWKFGDMPMDPIVKLVLNQNLGTENGFQIITASLASFEEIDYAVDELQRDLELARKEAKQTLHRQQLKTRTTPQ